MLLGLEQLHMPESRSDSDKEQSYVGVCMLLWCSFAFKTRLKESCMYRSWEIYWLLPKKINSPFLRLFQATWQSWNTLNVGSKARLCRCECFLSALDEFQEECPLHSRVHPTPLQKVLLHGYWRLWKQIVNRMCLTTSRSWAKWCLGTNRWKKACTQAFLLKQRLKTMMSELICFR